MVPGKPQPQGFYRVTGLDARGALIFLGSLPHTEGFFFGISTGAEKDDDLAFIAKAREALAEGDSLFYDSSW